MSQEKCRGTNCYHDGNPRPATPIWQRDRHNSPHGIAEANTQLEQPARMTLGMTLGSAQRRG
jgi:hypothetical protein